MYAKACDRRTLDDSKAGSGTVSTSRKPMQKDIHLLQVCYLVSLLHK